MWQQKHTNIDLVKESNHTKVLLTHINGFQWGAFPKFSVSQDYPFEVLQVLH